MSANIYGDRFYARGKPGWHNLGTVFPADQKIDLVTAMNHVIDYTVATYPLYAKVTLEDGTVIEVPMDNRVGVVRSPNKDSQNYVGLDVVSTSYKLVTDQALAEAFNEISMIWPVETVGVLSDGKRVFATLDAGMVDIGGVDPVHQFFLLTDDKGGRASTKAVYTPVRVVCQNTLTSGLAAASFTASFAHVSGNHDRIDDYTQAILDMQEGILNVNNLFNNMAKTPFDLNAFKRMVTEVVYPTPTAPVAPAITNEIDMTANLDVSAEFERLTEKAKAHQDAAIELFEKFNDEHAPIAGTQWAAWNAITELEDWKEGRGKLQFQSAVFGERARVKESAMAWLVQQ